MKTRILISAAALVAPLFLAAGPVAATTGHGGQQDCQSQLVPARLPHTADAIDGWFRACYDRQASHPATADAAAAWLIR